MESYKIPSLGDHQKVSTTDIVEGELQAHGFNASRLTVPGHGDIFIMRGPEDIAPKSVRVYRAYNHPTTILRQIPYAMRTFGEEQGAVSANEGLGELVDELAHKPAYANVAACVEAIRPTLSERDARYMDEELAQIEDGILQGISVRSTLRMSQISHNGGVADIGISPYLSAATEPRKAYGYMLPGGSLVVIDLPLSELETNNGNEVDIKGALDPAYITAIIPKESLDGRGETLDTVIGAIPHRSDLGSAELEEAKQQQLLNRQADTLRLVIDAQAVQRKRFTLLQEQFPEVSLGRSFQGGNEPYTVLLQEILSTYARRLSALYREDEADISTYEYTNRRGITQPMNANQPDPEMLLRLREIVERMEARNQQRLAARRERLT